MLEDYAKARKLGLKQVERDVAHGLYPYPPALDDILKNQGYQGEVPIGLAEIDLGLIAGTKTRGRQNMFSSGFLPIAETTSGKSIDETYPKVTGTANVEVKGLIVSLNRMEVGKGGVVTAQQEIQEKYGFPVASIVSMAEVVEALDGTVITPELRAAIDAYYEQYGVK